MSDQRAVALLVSHVTPLLGMERCVVRLVEELADQVDLVCIGESDAVPRARVLGGPLRGWSRVRSPARVRRWLADDDHDVILAAGVWAALPLLLVRPGDRRVIVWEHSFSRENINSSRNLAVLAAVARVLYRRADAVVCVSEDLGRQLTSRHFAVEPVIIPNYLGPPPQLRRSAVTPLLPHGTRRLLTVGSLSTIKNQKLALAALTHLGPQHVLAVAGAGPELSRLELYARENGVADQVLFLGHVADLGPWYRWCEAVVQPSLGETFGLAMFEAAAHHRPVVSLDYPLARDVVGSAVPGVCCGAEVAAMAAAVAEVLENPPSEHDFAQADHRRRHRFGTEAITRRWIEVLRPAGVGRAG